MRVGGAIELTSICWLCFSASTLFAQPPIYQRGGPIETTEACVPAEQRRFVDADIARNQPALSTAVVAETAVVPKLPFYPMGGTLWQDLWNNNYVDLDAGGGILDWDCSDYTYNGHDASDTDLRTFGEQDIGVPVFAALDGTVVSRQDGFNDHNTCPNAPCSSFANNVVLSHTDGRRTYYWHLRKNSVAVSVGQVVSAGQQIGLVGSSGSSSWSHLHFAVYDNSGTTLVEPYAGPCHAADSQWDDQVPTRRDTYIRDFGVTYESFGSYAGYPYTFPRSGQLALSDPTVNYWFLLQNLPVASTWRVRFERPDGTIAFDSGSNSFGNGSFYRFSWWWHNWNVADMHSITGTWHAWLDVNGVREATVPIEVRTARTPDFNRPPEPITVQLDPSAPEDNNVVFCRVNTDLILDDLDYQIVRYRYVWTVNGSVVRDNTFAGHADALPRGYSSIGQLLECTVTPSDGTADGPSASASAYIGPLVPCQPGTVSPSGAEPCTACSAGFYQPQSGQAACLPCDPGTFADSPGAAVCQACAAGTYQSLTGQASCDPCPCEDNDGCTANDCDAITGACQFGQICPTVSQWGLVTLALTLGICGTLLTTRRGP